MAKTAFSVENIPEESFAIAVAVLTVQHTAFQTVSLNDPCSLGAVYVGP